MTNQDSFKQAAFLGGENVSMLILQEWNNSIDHLDNNSRSTGNIGKPIPNRFVRIVDKDQNILDL